MAALPTPVPPSGTEREPTLWSNPARLWDRLILNDDHARHGARIDDARARFKRIAPLLVRLFPEIEGTGGRIDSPLVEVGIMRQSLGLDASDGRLLVKGDHALPVAGSIKARGGIHAVLEIAERVALSHGLLDGGDYAGLAAERARAVFSRHRLSVGSTGNLGLSVGIMAASLGFSATVHMSAEAKEWKKLRLRAHGATVVEHEGDYAAALVEGRAAAERDPDAYFIDDEDSESLLYGYATAAEDLARQLAEAGIAVDRDHPLIVHLPCGVGGAPTGIALGLDRIFGADVHCFFAEPVESACFRLEMAAEGGAHPTIYDAGLTGITEADGLAVPKASLLAARIARRIIAGVYTVLDGDMLRHVHLASRDEGLRLEPSAAAGFSGPGMLRRSPGGQAHLAASGLGERLRNATQVVWTTGGRLVPEKQFEDFDARGRTLVEGPDRMKCHAEEQIK